MPPTLSTTTNNAFRFPTDANNGTDFATGIADLGADVDGMWSSGTFSARPSASKLNRVYWATDVKVLYWDSGTAWEAVMLGGAWTSLTLASGWTAVGYTPACRVVGDTVELCGQITNNSGVTATNTIVTLPSGFFPVSQVRMGLTSNLSNTSYFPGALVVLAAAGAMAYYGPNQTTPVAISLDGLSFRLS